MREIQDIKRLLYPLVKGLPWITLFLIVTVALVWRLTDYQTPVYESKAVIRLDDHTSGFSDNNLYEDLDIFSETNDVLTEVEMIKSNMILLAGLRNMNSNIEYFRVGKLRTSELYTDTPFYIEVDSNNFKDFNELILVEIVSPERVNVVFTTDTIKACFGDKIKHNENEFVIHKSPFWIEDHGEDNLIGNYQFRVNTLGFLLSNFVEGNLFVKEIDKNVSVIQINFEGEHPERVADFTNAVAQAYLEDHIESKMQAAQLTEIFLDKRTNDTYQKLKISENVLEDYRLKNRVLNIRQETETDLRKIAQLDVQLINLQMKMVAMDSLENSIKKDRNSFLEVAPSYESYGGLLFTELIKKMKSLESDKTDLLNRYTASSEEVRSVEKKMDDITKYVVENIKSHRTSTALQLQKIESKIDVATRKMDDLPTTEKQMVMLEREFKHQQDLFNFLKKKQMEAGIAKLANLNFHRVINKALVSKDASRPNKGFNVALTGFLSLLLSIIFVYILQGIQSKINSRHQLEGMTEARILGAIKRDAHKSMDGSLDAVISELLPVVNMKHGVRISFNSSISLEGKTFLAREVAIALSSMGRKVLFIDFNSRNPQWQNLIASKSCEHSLEDYFKEEAKKEEVIHRTTTDGLSTTGFITALPPNRFYLTKNFEDQLSKLTKGFDTVIFDNTAYAIAPEAKVYMGHSDYSVYVVKHNFTSTKYLKNVDSIVKELGEENVGLVLNCVPQGVNYSGTFYGSRYMYNQPKGFKAKIKHYWESYKNAWNI